jgi:integrase
VLALYVRDKAGKLARPESAVSYTRALRPFWCGRPLSDVTGPHCRAYAAGRTTESMARHELEFLRAAINHHRKEGLHDRIVSVVLPDKPPPRERWLTRQEAAGLIRAAWRYREVQNARATDRHTRRHVARFMVVARYMGSRAAVICGASLEDKQPPGRPWVDLVRGVFHGRPAGQRVTKKRRQTMPLPGPLLAHMRRWHARGQRYVVQWNGRPVVSVSKAHRAVCREAGMPDVTPHVWRHTVATWMAQGGVNPRQAAEFLGMSLQTYLNVYVGQGGSDFSEVHAVL